MTNEEATEIIKAYKDRLTNSCSNLLDNDIEAFTLAIKALEGQTPKGEWIKSEKGEWISFGDKFSTKLTIRCNKCGKFVIKKENFCSNCGAKMHMGDDNK